MAARHGLNEAFREKLDEKYKVMLPDAFNNPRKKQTTYHFKKPPRKTNKICGALLVKEGLTYS